MKNLFLSFKKSKPSPNECRSMNVLIDFAQRMSPSECRPAKASLKKILKFKLY